MTHAPQFLILTSSDCQDVLDRNHVGRLAFINQRTVDIEPIGYVARGNWLFFRSAYGSKLEALAHNPFVAFEVDEVKGPFDWRSVVVHGTIYMLPADGAPIERREFERALAALRRVVPETLMPSDPTPARENVYGLHIDHVSGRMAQPATAKRGGRRAQPVAKAPKRRRPTNGS
ncbi:MAG: pyridoxamine 5'-phosphate oxidase family protein [Gemmatimonadaceae bacterium]